MCVYESVFVLGPVQVCVSVCVSVCMFSILEHPLDSSKGYEDSSSLTKHSHQFIFYCYVYTCVYSSIILTQVDSLLELKTKFPRDPLNQEIAQFASGLAGTKRNTCYI